MDNFIETNIKKSWADIVKNSNKTQKQPIQYVISKIQSTYNNIDEASTMKNHIYYGPMTKDEVFRNIWCWGEYCLLFPLINILTIDEINDLLNNIEYKLHDIDGWSDPEIHHDRKIDIIKCEEILVKQKQVLLKIHM